MENCQSNLQRDRNGKCRCPKQLPYYDKQLQRCVAYPPRQILLGCPANLRVNARGKCQCPPEYPVYNKQQRRCVPVQKCNSNLMYNRRARRCVCPKNLPKWNGNQCVDPRTACSSNLVLTRAGCRCPPDMPKWNGNRCVGKARVTFEIVEDTFQGVEFEGRPLLDSMKEWVARASAVYNKYTRLDIDITVSYGAGVPTAEAGWNWGTGKGDIRFGNSRGYHTLLHEFAHCVFTRYQDQWNALRSDGKWTGPRVNHWIKKFDGPDAVMGCDHMHFYPYQFNYANEYFDGADVRHAIMVQAFYDDITDLLCPDKTQYWDPKSNSCKS